MILSVLFYLPVSPYEIPGPRRSVFGDCEGPHFADAGKTRAEGLKKSKTEGKHGGVLLDLLEDSHSELNM